MQEDFVIDAETYFNNERTNLEDFYQRLITAFHMVPTTV